MNNIYFAEEGVKALNNYIENNLPSKVVFLIDENTHQHCLPQIIGDIEVSEEIQLEFLEIESGEENKTLEICSNLWEALTELNIDRNALIINIGGGVITDMGGFMAACFKRGVKFINIPTTLLAMVDASIGGKTGIDLNNLKNQIGVFANPEFTIIDSIFLETLETEHIINGFAEIVKHALIADKSYWDTLYSMKEIDVQNLDPIIKKSIEIKYDIVSKDFKEAGLRKSLNFGHTIGHAIESYFLEQGAPILHGYAVASGMIGEAYLSNKKGKLSAEELILIKEYIASLFTKIDIPKDKLSEIAKLALHDKKNTHGTINCVFLDTIGTCSIDNPITIEEIEEALRFYLEQ